LTPRISGLGKIFRAFMLHRLRWVYNTRMRSRAAHTNDRLRANHHARGVRRLERAPVGPLLHSGFQRLRKCANFAVQMVCGAANRNSLCGECTRRTPPPFSRGSNGNFGNRGGGGTHTPFFPETEQTIPFGQFSPRPLWARGKFRGTPPSFRRFEWELCDARGGKVLRRDFKSQDNEVIASRGTTC
jgi:hypothetical protein